MNYQLLYPAMFVALAGLLIPLLIHLWNRQRGRVVLFGSTQFLESTQRKKISRLSFSQPLLFFLRALMIAICVLLLVEPVRVTMLQVLPQKNPNWLLIHPSLLARNDWQNAIDTTRYRKYEQRVLARGFALLHPQRSPTSSVASADSLLGGGGTWSLLADVASHAQAPDSIAVYFTPKLNDFEGIPPTLSTHITWHEIPLQNDSYHILRAWQASDNKVALIIGKSDEEKTIFERFIFVENNIIQTDELPDIIIEKKERLVYLKNKKDLAVLIENKPKLSATIYYDSAFKKDRNYINAALKSIAEYTDIQIDIERKRIVHGTSHLPSNEATDAVFWLSETTLNDSLESESNIRLFVYKKKQVYREDIIEKAFVEGKEIHILTRRITDAESTTQLPQSLLKILLTPDDFDAQLYQFDQRKITPSQYKTARTSNSQYSKKSLTEKKRITGFHNTLWWILLGLFLIERSVKYEV